jgi:hypothetical protein
MTATAQHVEECTNELLPRYGKVERMAKLEAKPVCRTWNAGREIPLDDRDAAILAARVAASIRRKGRASAIMSTSAMT